MLLHLQTPSSLLHWLYCFGRLIYYNIQLMIICKKSLSWITLFYRSSNNKMQKLRIDIIFLIIYIILFKFLNCNERKELNFIYKIIIIDVA